MMMLSFYSIRMMAVCGRRGLMSSNKLIIRWYCSRAKELVCLVSDCSVTLLHNTSFHQIIVTMVTAQCHNIIILTSWKYHSNFRRLYSMKTPSNNQKFHGQIHVFHSNFMAFNKSQKS